MTEVCLLGEIRENLQKRLKQNTPLRTPLFSSELSVDWKEQNYEKIHLNNTEVLRETRISLPLESTNRGICETPVAPLCRQKKFCLRSVKEENYKSPEL